MGAVVLVFAFIGARPIMDSSEARYADVARAMAADGDWLVPHLNGQSHLTKPPLAYWLLAISIRFLGTGEAAARLMVGIFAILTVILTFEFGKRLSGEAAGIVSGWFQLLAITPLVAANVITTDTFLATFETGAMLCAWGSLNAPGNRGARRHAVCMWAFLAAAFMTKGPAGMLPLLPLAAFCVFHRRNMKARRLLPLSGLALFGALALPWYAAVAIAVPDAWGIWRQQALVNVMEESVHHTSPATYIAMLTLGALPGAAALPFALRAIRRRKGGGGVFRPGDAFLLLWILVPLAVLSLQKTRLPLYVLPLYPPVSILCAGEMARRWFPAGTFALRRVPWPALVLCLLFAAASVIGKREYGARVEELDPSRCFREVAARIREDARALGLKPAIIIKEPRLGYGLMYYLDGPPMLRVAATDRKIHADPLHVAQALKEPVPPGYAQYFVIKTSNIPRYRNLFDAHMATFQGNGAYTVWRRTAGEPIHVELPQDIHEYASSLGKEDRSSSETGVAR